DAVYEQAETMLLSKQPYLDNKREIELLDEAIENETVQLQSGLEQLQIGLTITGLKEMTFPFYLERTWDELKQANDQIHLETEQTDLESALPDEKDIIHLTEKVNAYHQQDYEQSHLKKTTKDKIKWEQVVKRKNKQSNIIFISCGILAVLLFILPIAADISNTFFVLSLFVWMGGTGLWIWQKHSIHSLAVLFAGNDSTNTDASITPEEKESAAYELHHFRKKQQAIDTLAEEKRTLKIQLLQWEE